MEVFLSTYRNRIDAKGRISVPAPYRAVLAKQGPEGGLYLGPDWVSDAINESRVLVAGGTAYLNGVHSQIAALPEFSAARADLEDTLLASLTPVSLDTEGRIVLPQPLIEHAGLAAAGEAVFVGRGSKFLIWEPKAWEVRQSAARAATRARLRQGDTA